MVTSYRTTLAVIFALTLILGMPSLFVSFTSNASSMQIMTDENTNLKNAPQIFSPSAQGLTTWYHDGSNTTGWTTSYNGWTLNSSGTALHSNVTSSGGPEHAVFVYYFNTPFVVGHDFKIEAQVQYTATGYEDGGLNLMTFYSSSFVYRLAYTATGSSKVSWAVNHYTGQFDVNDYEYTINYMNYSLMWYNSTDSTTRTNLGDGIISTSEHAAETRRINNLVLNFWAQNGATSPDIQVDWIKITGGVVPEIDSPDDVEMEYSDSVDLIWIPEAYAPDNYELYIDDVLDDFGPWDGSQLSFPLTYLDPGFYKYELIVYDDLDNSASDIVWVNVTDTTTPIISDVADFSIPYGVSGEYLTWSCDEPYPDYFVITQDSVVIDEGAWNGTDLRVNLNGLSVDSYIFVVSANDTFGNSATDEVIVSVILDDDPPSVTPLDDVSFEFGITGIYLVWSCSDLFPDSYIIYRNSSVVDSDLWNGSNLAVNLDGLNLGTYNYTIILYDTSGNSASDSVIVTVAEPETTPPPPTTTTTTGVTQPIDPMLFVIAGAAGAFVFLIIIVLMKKK
ncbi:hypothetical protein EU527_18190 [Candidatus Thorarchaeota archaeon]|nr:MAG: hypothetical protein EU527_18190 [Candidatus Thorarchaeota archaeon]